MYKKYLPGFFILLLIFIVGLIGFNAYSYFFLPPKHSPTGSYVLTVNSGENITAVATRLEQAKVIPSTNSLILQARLNSVNNLQSGKYELNVPDSPEGILNQIRTRSDTVAEELQKLKSVPVTKITFKEGENLDQMIAKLDQEGIATKADLEAVAKDYTKFSTTKYPFLPTPLTCSYGDLKNCAKYYLEGYLYPDTYNFVKGSDSVKVYETLLNNFSSKVWSRLGNQVNGKDFYTIVTMASVMERETGRTKGVTDANRDELSGERKLMAEVFYNRLEQKMKWQSDVTVEYGTGKKLCQQTFILDNCIKLDSPLANTKYNTYSVVGYPIGPITSPQFDNINAALNPTDNDYLYFAADGSGKKYFAKTYADHLNNIKLINKINTEAGLT